MKITVDSREQTPYGFELPVYAEVSVESGTLATGDYSLRGLEKQVAVERKSLPDLMACMGRERERFMAEMERARGLDAFAVVAECAWRDIASGNYRSKVRPKAAIATLSAIMARYGIPIIFAGSRAGGEFATYCFLRQFAKGRAQEAKALLSALEEDGKGGDEP